MALITLRAFLIAGVVGGVVAGCGMQAGHQPSGHQAAGWGKGGQRSGAASGGACTTAHLAVRLDLRSAGVAAGTSLIPLNFTNVGAASCRLAGFALVTFATSRSGGQVGAAAAADRAVTAKALLLGAGQTAHLWLKVVQAANLPASRCRPQAVAGLRVRLPGEDASVFIPHQFMTCAKRVHGTDILTVEPFQAGRAHSGTAQ